LQNVPVDFPSGGAETAVENSKESNHQNQPIEKLC
jgi:hypothetical protein